MKINYRLKIQHYWALCLISKKPFYFKPTSGSRYTKRMRVDTKYSKFIDDLRKDNLAVYGEYSFYDDGETISCKNRDGNEFLNFDYSNYDYNTTIFNHKNNNIKNNNIKNHTDIDKSNEKEISQLKEILGIREKTYDIELYQIEPKTIKTKSDTISISLFSDFHCDEVVLKESVLNKNEYNIDIAKKRADNYFANLVKLVSHHQKNYTINRHILGFVGDIIGGFIHEELMQTNSMTPLEAISFAKTTIMSGLKFLNDNLNVDNIDVICVVGNHGRTTKKIQHSNRTETSYEYFLYKDLEIMCKTLGLNKINFIIPKSSIVMIEVLGKKLAFTHGDNFKYIGGIGGLYVPLLKYIAKLKSTFEIDMLFFGHYHTTVFIKEAIGNGSIKGYDAFSMNKGFSYEPPQQSLVLLNETRGFTNYQPIFLD